jgi:hypothetical protein
MARTVCIAVAAALCLSSCTRPAPAKPPLSSTAGPGARDSVAIAIVYNGWEVWIGNDDMLLPDDPSRYPGALHELAAAVDAAKLSTRAASDLGMLVVYNDKAAVRLPMGPLSRLTGASFGSQKDYFGVKGLELAKGVELALHELENTTASRKVLIVAGDGSDTNPAQARPKLAALAGEARSNHVQVYAIVFDTALTFPEQRVLPSLTSNARTARTVGDIRPAFESVLSECCSP